MNKDMNWKNTMNNEEEEREVNYEGEEIYEGFKKEYEEENFKEVV